MVAFVFTLPDLGRTRFAISPVWELVTSLRVLRDPRRATMHLPWVREALPAARGLDLALPFALTPPSAYIPDFLTPPPTTPVATVEDELAALRATEPARVHAGVTRLLDGRPAPAPVAALLADPVAGMDRLAEALAVYWERVLAPDWPRVRALLEADVAHRAQVLAAAGPARLLGELHDAVRWREDRLEVDQEHTAEVALAGRGLVLVPTAFQWEAPMSISDPPWQPTLLYPARGVALLWDAGAPRSGAVAGVLGRTRAALLELLGAPQSTTAVAARLDMSPAGVSEHLTALRDAGLVTAGRHGRSVLYVRTPLAERLLHGG